MKSEKISVVIPVYKVEPYLDKCVQSIVDQTYTDLEIILVDDGSPDACPKICDRWAEKDSRVRVIHKTNGGLSDARNYGMAIATGEYIGFVDGDDYIEPEMYGLLQSEMENTDSDISSCGIRSFWENGERKILTVKGNAVLDNKSAMEALVNETWLKQPVWNKLYKAHLVKDILFEKGKCHEDVFWTYQIIAKANKVCVLDLPLYNYRQRNNSIMGEGFSHKRIDALEAKSRFVEFLRQGYPTLINSAQNSLFFFAMYLMQQALNSRKKPTKEAAAAICSYAKKYPASNVIGIKQKIWVILSKISFILTCRIRNLLKIGI